VILPQKGAASLKDRAQRSSPLVGSLVRQEGFSAHGVDHYERLREDALNRRAGSGAQGLALFLKRGMFLWLRQGLPETTAYVAAELEETELPVSLQVEMVRLIAGMVIGGFRQHQESRGEERRYA